MTRCDFRALLAALIDTALEGGWCLPDVQGELAVAGMELDERLPAPSCLDEDDPFA